MTYKFVDSLLNRSLTSQETPATLPVSQTLKTRLGPQSSLTHIHSLYMCISVFVLAITGVLSFDPHRLNRMNHLNTFQDVTLSERPACKQCLQPLWFHLRCHCPISMRISKYVQYIYIHIQQPITKATLIQPTAGYNHKAGKSKPSNCGSCGKFQPITGASHEAKASAASGLRSLPPLVPPWPAWRGIRFRKSNQAGKSE